MNNAKDGYSQEYFQEFLKLKIIKDWKVMGEPARTVSQIKAPAYIFMSLGLLACLLPIVDPGSVKGDFVTSLFLAEFSGCAFFLAGYINYSKIQVFEKMEKYFIFKNGIITENKKLEVFIKNDIQDSGIDIFCLVDVQSKISSILECYRLISKCHEYIQSHMWYFGKIPMEGQNIINAEFQWIVNYSQEFTLLIQSWMSHHALELAELEKQIQSQESSTESESGQAALEIQRISLQEHLKKLEVIQKS